MLRRNMVWLKSPLLRMLNLVRGDPDERTGRVCPTCGSRDLSRIRRRPVDRIYSLFFPVRRYRCCAFACNWEGVLKVH